MNRESVEKRICNDAYMIRREYAGRDLRNNAHDVCAFIVEGIRLRLQYDNHPLAALLADMMTDEYRAKWREANGKTGPGC